MQVMTIEVEGWGERDAVGTAQWLYTLSAAV